MQLGLQTRSTVHRTSDESEWTPSLDGLSASKRWVSSHNSVSWCTVSKAKLRSRSTRAHTSWPESIARTMKSCIYCNDSGLGRVIDSISRLSTMTVGGVIRCTHWITRPQLAQQSSTRSLDSILVKISWDLLDWASAFQSLSNIGMFEDVRENIFLECGVDHVCLPWQHSACPGSASLLSFWGPQFVSLSAGVEGSVPLIQPYGFDIRRVRSVRNLNLTLTLS